MSIESQYMWGEALSSCTQDYSTSNSGNQAGQWAGYNQQQAAPISPPCQQSQDWAQTQSMGGYTTYPTDNMRVPPMYHPNMETQNFPQHAGSTMLGAGGDHAGLMWTKAALENQCQGYLRYNAHNLHATTVARRNERERNRVRHINSTFENLRQHLPCNNKKKKLSKVDTLRTAIKYIKHLQTILGDNSESESSDLKSIIKVENNSSDVVTSDSKTKRQSLDSSMHSTSSVEDVAGLPVDNDIEQEQELMQKDYGIVSGSPCSGSESGFLLPDGSDDFSWPGTS